MTRRRLAAALALAALAVAGALAANLVLLGLATQRNDPVGRLRPVVAIDRALRPTVPVETATTPTTTPMPDDEAGADEDD